MEKRKKFHVKTSTLLAIAGSVWLIAGFNVVRMGILSYLELDGISILQIILSFVVFFCFGFMFYKMTDKHTRRISGYSEPTKPIWLFFDIKSYCIMIFMMGGGIWLRSSGLAPPVFIAVFYTGLGCGLALAGFVFWYKYFSAQLNKDE